ncbi:hypothetical protein CSC94_21830 [Zhengella mangrovi]|uniref:Uncharacterized protein n=1 Tax=Zhengella mangrovi TaxID=1982044 RepID=A0A2G1QHI2_9HYPH|nr:hypothetical protein [Zhengella mangrovi]PHP64976.1 hypothetical protein CSC94_21830 [Zhengella mangrovi]
MSDAPICWQRGSCSVTSEAVRTRFVSIALADIDLVQLRLPLAAATFAGAIGTSFLALRFRDVATAPELLALLGLGWGAALLGIVTAQLKLSSYSIHGVTILLPIWRAIAMRRAIDETLSRQRPSLIHDHRRRTA